MIKVASCPYGGFERLHHNMILSPLTLVPSPLAVTFQCLYEPLCRFTRLSDDLPMASLLGSEKVWRILDFEKI